MQQRLILTAYISYTTKKCTYFSYTTLFSPFYLIYHTFAWHSKLWHMRQSSVFYMVYEIETKCTSISQIPHFLEVWYMRKRKTTTLSEIPYFWKLMQSLQIIPQYYISKLSYNSTYQLRFFLPKMDLQVGTTFNNITEAKLAIKTFVANAAESWKSYSF